MKFITPFAIAAILASPASATPTIEAVPMSGKTCTSIIAGMYNDAKTESGVVVEYTVMTLTLVGNGREYFVSCDGNTLRFAGSIEASK